MKGFFKDLSFAQIAAGALAAATSFLLSSKIGIAGSLIGVVVGSVVSAVSTQVYKKAIAGSADVLKQSLGVDSHETTGAESAGENGPGARTLSPSDGAAGMHRRQPTDMEASMGGATPWRAADTTRSLDDSRTTRLDGGGEDDLAETTAAIASLDSDPTLLVGEDGATVYPASQARRDAIYANGPTQAYTSSPASVSDRTVRMPGRAGLAHGSDTLDATQAYPRQTTTNREGSVWTTSGRRASTGGASQKDEPSRYGSVAAQEAQARRIARKRTLVGVVSVLSALAAVAVVAVLVNVLTSGDGIGYKPPAIMAPSDGPVESPVQQNSAVQDETMPGAAPVEPANTNQAGTTLTPGATEPAAGEAQDPTAGAGGEETVPDAEAGENAGGTDGSTGVTTTPGAGTDSPAPEVGTGNGGQAGTGEDAGETTPAAGGEQANAEADAPAEQAAT